MGTKASVNQEKKSISLAPKVLTNEQEVKKIKPYLKALKKAIELEDVNNIALTGAYGSGKSTILKTFQVKNPKHKYLNISLATFKDEIIEEFSETTESGINKRNEDRLIEVSILQQIFYHVEASEIPDSRFKRIKSYSNKQLRIISVGFIVWLISAIIFYKYSFISKFNPENWTFSIKSIDFVAILIISFFFLGIAILTEKLIRFLNGSKISKFNFLKGEIELGKDVDKSIFNEHLDEILYFFESTSYNVVIIEDLDRFRNTEIFTKLREINLLINNSKSINQKVMFLYAIRDDIFKNEERTKFFDYIVPVIPFINPSSASEKLTELIENAGLKHDFSDDFIDGVVTFIDDIDMRLLTNIFHEYIIYKECLGSKLIQDNLLAIIIYKNVYPKDFVDLGKNKGNLFEFFNNRDKYINKHLTKIDDEILENSNEIDELENEKINNIKELRAIYINAIREKINDAFDIVISNERMKFSELNNEENFELLQEIDNIQYSYYHKGRYNNTDYFINTTHSDLSFEDIEKYVNSNFTFKDREKLINKNINDKTNELKSELDELIKLKDEIKNWSIRQVFETVEIAPFLEKFSNNNLMSNLLLNGYIDENYSHYITLFHEVNITEEDYDFERKVKRGTYSPYDFRLTKIKNLTKKIPLKYFSKKSILNYDLLAFIINNRENNEKKCNAIFTLLSKTKYGTQEVDENFRFIRGYLFDYTIDESIYRGFNSKNLPLFLNELLTRWSEFWDYIDSRSGLPKKEKDKFLYLIIKYVDIDTIISLNDSSKLYNYVSNDSRFLSLIDEEDEQKACTLIQKLSLKFKILAEPNKETERMFEFIYHNDLYQLNIENIRLMCKTYNASFIEEDFNNSNYTYVINSGNKQIKGYIENEINVYIKDVMLKIETNSLEDEEVLLRIYNDVDIEVNSKLKLIKKQDTFITDFSKIEDEGIFPNFIINQKIKTTWANMFAYFKYCSNAIDEVLVEYLNEESVYNILTKYKIKDINQNKEDIKDFTIELIKCNELTLESYSSLIKASNYTWSSINIENLNSDKVSCLIKDNILSLSVQNFKKLKEHFGLHIELLEKHEYLFIVKFNEFILENEDIINLLRSTKLSKGNKLELLNKIENTVIIENSEIGKIACNLFANTDYIPLSYELIYSLFESSLSIQDRVKLLNLHFDSLEKENVKELLDLLGGGYSDILKPYGKPSFSVEPYNLFLSENLEKRKYISSKKISKDKLKIYAFNK